MVVTLTITKKESTVAELTSNEINFHAKDIIIRPFVADRVE